ncbi:hypothetical protein D9615_002720 [Tricholomella constricta]|uniref:Heme oxygenase n=1 Tax=Tricholomella constricta TaxID=117010 RepID=A0A8H5HGP2_9AGAR|nr:hypothetical protein D9615_002720 [Tricholomella constricta]
MTSLDLSLPLATLLRESTHEVHIVVERSPGAMAILRGQLRREEYVRYLIMLWHIYDAFEQALDRHARHPVLAPTYNPTLLARAPALAADISFLLQVPEASWKSHPAHAQLLQSTPPALATYVHRIHELADSADPTPLLAHSYVRYLGDLSGGQIIRRTLRKAYGLDQGLSFYDFKELQSAKLANQGEKKRIKEWFREGLNTAGELSVDVKAAVIKEADLAFDLNARLFMCIDVESPSQDTEGVIENSEKHQILIEETSRSNYERLPLSQVAAVIVSAWFI